MLTTTASALKAIGEHGFLNEFSTMGDTWFVAHSVPAGDSEDAVPVPARIAYRLIDEGRLERLGAGTALGDAGTAVTWYCAKPQEGAQRAAQ